MNRNVWLIGIGLLLVVSLAVRLIAQESQVDTAESKSDAAELGVIRGAVVQNDAERTPVAGARVHWFSRNADRRGSVTTDENGNYAITELKPGEYVLGAQAEGYGDNGGWHVTVVAGNETLYDIKMRTRAEIATSDPGTIRGAVVQNDAERTPVGAARVEWMNPHGDRGHVTTDENGNYSIGNLKPGQYVLNVQHPGLKPRQGLMVSVVGGNETLFDIRMRPPTDAAPAKPDQVITCKGIRLVDSAVNVRAYLGVMENPQYPGEDVLQIFNKNGVVVGALSLSPSGGWLRLHANEGDMRAEMRVDSEGALTRVYGKDTANRAGISATDQGGIAATYSGSAGVTVSSHREGGSIVVSGPQDQLHVAVQSYPNRGHIAVYDSDGNEVATLP